MKSNKTKFYRTTDNVIYRPGSRYFFPPVFADYTP